MYVQAWSAFSYFCSCFPLPHLPSSPVSLTKSLWQCLSAWQLCGFYLWALVPILTRLIDWRVCSHMHVWMHCAVFTDRTLCIWMFMSRWKHSDQARSGGCLYKSQQGKPVHLRLIPQGKIGQALEVQLWEQKKLVHVAYPGDKQPQ